MPHRRLSYIMTARSWPGLLLGAMLGATVVQGGPAAGEESLRRIDGIPAVSASADKALLDAMVKDFGLIQSRSGENNLRVPLTPRDWSLSGLRPYAALSARTLKPVTDGVPGLAAPSRESTEDPSHGLGLGAGFEWQLSQHVGLFGEYLFQTRPGTNVPGNSPTLRPDAEAPAGLKGGFSLRF